MVFVSLDDRQPNPLLIGWFPDDSCLLLSLIVINGHSVVGKTFLPCPVIVCIHMDLGGPPRIQQVGMVTVASDVAV